MSDNKSDTRRARFIRRWLGVHRPGEPKTARVIYAANRFLAQQRAQQPETPPPAAPAARAS